MVKDDAIYTCYIHMALLTGLSSPLVQDIVQVKYIQLFIQLYLLLLYYSYIIAHILRYVMVRFFFQRYSDVFCTFLYTLLIQLCTA